MFIDKDGYDVIEIDKHYYALIGWNGTLWHSCLEVDQHGFWLGDKTEYAVTPIYKFTEDGDSEIIDYEFLGRS